jgi:hypothetical protein
MQLTSVGCKIVSSHERPYNVKVAYKLSCLCICYQLPPVLSRTSYPRDLSKTMPLLVTDLRLGKCKRVYHLFSPLQYLHSYPYDKSNNWSIIVVGSGVFSFLFSRIHSYSLFGIYMQLAINHVQNINCICKQTLAMPVAVIKDIQTVALLSIRYHHIDLGKPTTVIFLCHLLLYFDAVATYPSPDNSDYVGKYFSTKHRTWRPLGNLIFSMVALGKTSIVFFLCHLLLYSDTVGTYPSPSNMFPCNP